MRSKREWVQVELKVLASAEPWILVRHRGGTFKLPMTAFVSEVLEGVRHGWTMETRHLGRTGATVRVPLATWRDLEARAATRGHAPTRERVRSASSEPEQPLALRRDTEAHVQAQHDVGHRRKPDS